MNDFPYTVRITTNSPIYQIEKSLKIRDECFNYCKENIGKCTKDWDFQIINRYGIGFSIELTIEYKFKNQTDAVEFKLMMDGDNYIA